MELLDRYLNAVEFWLPKAHRRDLIAELSEDLRSQIDEREAELGRNLNDGEVGEILKRCGSPVTVASRYRPQRYLIGPTLFPIYRFTLVVLVMGCVIPRFVIWLAFLLIDPVHRGYLHMENLWATVLYAIFFTTLAFAIVEGSGVQLEGLNTWNPRKLPPARDPNRISRFSALNEVAWAVIFNVWFVGMFWPRPAIDFYGARLTLAPTWQLFFWGFLLLAAANVALALVNLFRPYWTRPRATIRLLLDGIGALLFCWLLKAQVLIGISAPSLAESNAIKLTSQINYWIMKALPWAILVMIVIVAVDAYRIWRVGRTDLHGGCMGSRKKQFSNPAVNGNGLS